MEILTGHLHTFCVLMKAVDWSFEASHNLCDILFNRFLYLRGKIPESVSTTCADNLDK